MDSKFFASGKYEEDLTEVSLCYSLWLEMFTTQSIADVEWLANSASVSRIRDENSSSYSISSVSVTFRNFLLLWASAPPKHYPPSHYPTPSISKMRAKTLHERGHLEWEVHAKVRTAVLVKLPERFLVSLFCRLVLFHTDISYFCKTMTKYNITGTIHWWGTISLRSHWCWEHCPQQGISIQSLNKLRPQYMRLINDNENENNKSSGTMVWS